MSITLPPCFFLHKLLSLFCCSAVAYSYSVGMFFLQFYFFALIICICRWYSLILLCLVMNRFYVLDNIDGNENDEDKYSHTYYFSYVIYIYLEMAK